jgi:hypothetical protein
MYSENFIEAILAGGCVYCGMDAKELQSFTGHCLDRIDNRGKHTSNNVAACCPQCNSIKSNLLTIEEMSYLHEGLQAIRIRRGNMNAAHINAKRNRRKNG